MKTFAMIVKLLAVSLLLAGSLVSSPAMAADKVDINTADAATLDETLANVGPTKAAAIIDYREAHGDFQSAEQLALVKGIGLKTIEKNRDRIEVGDAGSDKSAP